MKTSSTTTVDAYIDGAAAEDQALLRAMRKTIREAAPEAEETIGYGMPTYKLQGNLVHFAAFKNHIGFYPAPSGLAAFAEELKGYKGSKGAVQFPKDQPLPLDVVRAITHFRIAENSEKAKGKRKVK